MSSESREKKTFKKVRGKHLIYSYRLVEKYDPETKETLTGMELGGKKLSSEPIARMGDCVYEVAIVDCDGNVSYTVQFLASTNGMFTARLSTKKLEGTDNYYMMMQSNTEPEDTEMKPMLW
ncbi:GL25783 [Drosophila persimilis]|uniref:GL25783 n=1 Tax=Drosophila persimilis TaxID=7234 RepID=B4GJY2_DROPE|nr:GL25783 [Drosophila persimilis]